MSASMPTPRPPSPKRTPVLTAPHLGSGGTSAVPGCRAAGPVSLTVFGLQTPNPSTERLGVDMELLVLTLIKSA